MLTRRRFLIGSGLAAVAVTADVLARRIPRGGSGGFTGPVVDYTVHNLTSAPEGGWVWFGAARAITNGSTTIAGYLRDGGLGGDVRAVIIDNATRTVTSTTTLYDNFLDDDHEPPSFVVRPDGVIMTAFAYHVGELYVGIGASAGVLPAQAQVTNITSQVGTVSQGVYGYTYASIFYLEAESRYYIFARYHNSSGVPYFVYTVSNDSGATWSAHTVISQITYHQITKNGTGRFDFVMSDHPDHGQGDNPAVKTSIYHAYYDGTWHKSDGTGLTLPIANTGATLVYDGTTTRAWLWDIAIESGNPRVVFVTYAEPYATGAWTYRWGRWNGSAWSTQVVADAGTTIVTAGAEHYAGGIVLDHSNPNVVYYSSNSSGSFQVYRAVTANDGVSWTVTQITTGSDKNVRPVSILGHGSDLEALYLFGTYTDYSTYSQGIRGIG